MCRKRFQHKAALLIHTKYFHKNKSSALTNQTAPASENRSRHQCELCSKTFDFKCRLNSHIARVHENQFNCDKCPRRFLNKPALLIHMKYSHKQKSSPVSQLPFKCDVCSKTFQFRCRLNSHARIHQIQTQKKFKCDQCNRFFNHHAKLSKHKRTVHTEQMEQSMHACEICGKVYKYKHNLKRHVEFDHKVKRIARSDNRCGICNKQFAFKGNINRHIRLVHEKLKPFKCSFCDNCFGEKTQLKLHIRSVHKNMKK